MNDMRKNILLAAPFLFLFSITISAQEDVSQAKWQENKIVIDGHDSENNESRMEH